jgi:pyrroloquinoline quinone biosynthesis protein D
MTDAVVIDETSIPRLADHVTMRFDEHRERWVILAPERVLILDEVSVEILKRCDGKSVAQVIDDLAAAFEAPRADIARDVMAMLQGLADKGTIAA